MLVADCSTALIPGNALACMLLRRRPVCSLPENLLCLYCGLPLPSLPIAHSRNWPLRRSRGLGRSFAADLLPPPLVISFARSLVRRRRFPRSRRPRTVPGGYPPSEGARASLAPIACHVIRETTPATHAYRTVRARRRTVSSGLLPRRGRSDGSLR